MTIISLLEQIKRNEIVLPAIQRDFVWPKKKIIKLLDSLMRGYPIGLVLFWETFDDIQHRKFVTDYQTGVPHIFHYNNNNRRLQIVLDGQQRLQSLYTALYGTYERKYLYFDVLSGIEDGDFEEEKFHFYFLTHEEAEEWNQESISNVQSGGGDEEVYYFINVNELLTMGILERKILPKKISEELKLSEKEKYLIDINISILNDVLTKGENILKTLVIDKEKPKDSPDRKSVSDVLEIFFRINREGTPLNRSDLIFSMLKLKWKESAEALPKFVRSMNEGNSFGIDSDFVIRCLFAVSDLGTKYDINILRKQTNIEKIKVNFEDCCNAIRSVIDFIQDECWMSSTKLLRGHNTLVPFVYYLFHTQNKMVPNSQIERVRKALYLFSFTSPFSRWADSRLKKFIDRELKPLTIINKELFPLEGCVSWINYWENIEHFDEQLIQGNPSLALHLVQRRSGGAVQYEKNAPQIDHIFPRSKLREYDFDEGSINHFANYWILARNKNINKSNRHPKKYFRDVPDFELERAFIDRNLLDYEYYEDFLKKRKDDILKKIKKELNFSDADFHVPVT